MDECLTNMDLETLTNEEFKARISKDLAKFKIKDRVVSYEELPKAGSFDVYACLSENPNDFGTITEVEQLGHMIRYKGHSEIKVGDKTVDMHGSIGQVMMQSYSRVVMMIETNDVPKYFGWLNPSDYELVNMHQVGLVAYLN